MSSREFARLSLEEQNAVLQQIETFFADNGLSLPAVPNVDSPSSTRALGPSPLDPSEILSDVEALLEDAFEHRGGRL